MSVGFSLFEITYSGTQWPSVSTGEEETGIAFLIGYITVKLYITGVWQMTDNRPSIFLVPSPTVK
jgi:hypothetical protein